jgi:hypothetical protein
MYAGKNKPYLEEMQTVSDNRGGFFNAFRVAWSPGRAFYSFPVLKMIP